jgi:hypothetical protein
MGDSVSWYPRTSRMKSFAITAGTLALPRDFPHGLQHFGAERLEVSGVGDGKHLEHEVHGREFGKYFQTDEFAEPAFEAVPIDTRLLVLGHHEANAGKRMKGRQSAHIQ